MPQKKVVQTKRTPPSTGLQFMTWNEITRPGVYVDMQYPRFFRVLPENLSTGASPAIHASEFTVARISSDPLLNKKVVQLLCADNNLPIPE